jgi:hypothetical protein
MFNFFKKKPDEQENTDVVASITYLIKQGSSEPLIDVALNDNDDECVEALCLLLDVLGNDMFYLDTVNMIKSMLLQSHQEDILFKVLTRINNNVREKIVNSHKEKTKDEPCIKPSDMLR